MHVAHPRSPYLALVCRGERPGRRRCVPAASVPPPRVASIAPCPRCFLGLLAGSDGSSSLTRQSAGQEDQRLSVEPGQVYDRAYKTSGSEIEGYDVVLPDAVQAAIWPEPQSPRPAKSDRGFWCEDAHELPGDRVIFAHARQFIARIVC